MEEDDTSKIAQGENPASSSLLAGQEELTLLDHNPLFFVEHLFKGLNAAAAKAVRKHMERYYKKEGGEDKELMEALKRLEAGKGVLYRDILIVDERLSALKTNSKIIEKYVDNNIYNIKKQIAEKKPKVIGTLAVYTALLLILDEIDINPQHEYSGHKDYLEQMKELYGKQVAYIEKHGFSNEKIIEEMDSITSEYKKINDVFKMKSPEKEGEGGSIENIFQHIDKDLNNTKKAAKLSKDSREVKIPVPMKAMGVRLQVREDNVTFVVNTKSLQEYASKVMGVSDFNGLQERINEMRAELNMMEEQKRNHQGRKDIAYQKLLKNIKEKTKAIKNLDWLQTQLEKEDEWTQEAFVELLEGLWNENTMPEKEKSLLEKEIEEIKDFLKNVNYLSAKRRHQVLAKENNGLMAVKYNQGHIAAVGEGHCSAFTFMFNELYEKEMMGKEPEEQFLALLKVSEKAWQDAKEIKSELASLNVNALTTNYNIAQEQITPGYSGKLLSLSEDYLPLEFEGAEKTRSAGGEAVELLAKNHSLYLTIRNKQDDGHAIFIANDARGYWLIDSNSGAYFFDKQVKDQDGNAVEQKDNFENFINQYLKENYKDYNRFKYSKFDQKATLQEKKSLKEKATEVLTRTTLGREIIDADISLGQAFSHDVNEWQKQITRDLSRMGVEIDALKQRYEEMITPLNKKIETLEAGMNVILHFVKENKKILLDNQSNIKAQHKALVEIKEFKEEISEDMLLKVMAEQKSIKEGFGLKLHSFFNSMEKKARKDLNEAYQKYEAAPNTENRSKLRGLIKVLQEQRGYSSHFVAHMNNIVDRINTNQDEAVKLEQNTQKQMQTKEKVSPK